MTSGVRRLPALAGRNGPLLLSGGVLLGSAAAMPAAAPAGEQARVESLWLVPVSARHGPAAPAPALFDAPPGWVPGDAVALVVADRRAAPEGTRDRLGAALLREGAAVLELDAPGARGPAPDDSAAPPGARPPDDPLPDLFAALAAVRRDAGAGLVVALGHGEGGEAALRVTDEGAAVRHLGADGPRFAAAGVLGPRRVAFAAGAAPPASEGWPRRAPLLCAALARAAEPEPAAAVRRDCVAALAPGAPPRGPARTGGGP
jgi:hypothetical protein